MNKIVITIGILLTISIGINIWFFSGKGIVINNNITNDQRQWQQQWQGQLLINQWTSQGNTIEWKTIETDYDNIISDLNKLHPISSMYAKIIKFDSKIEVYYPKIFTKTKEELKQ
jgi:hypothetical protein